MQHTQHHNVGKRALSRPVCLYGARELLFLILSREILLVATSIPVDLLTVFHFFDPACNSRKCFYDRGNALVATNALLSSNKREDSTTKLCGFQTGQ